MLCMSTQLVKWSGYTRKEEIHQLLDKATCPLFQAEQWELLMLQRKSYRLNVIQVPQHSDSITSR